MQPQMHHASDHIAIPSKQKGTGTAARHEPLHQRASVPRTQLFEHRSSRGDIGEPDHVARRRFAGFGGIKLDKDGRTQGREVGSRWQVAIEIDKKVGWEVGLLACIAIRKPLEECIFGPGPRDHTLVGRGSKEMTMVLEYRRCTVIEAPRRDHLDRIAHDIITKPTFKLVRANRGMNDATFDKSRLQTECVAVGRCGVDAVPGSAERANNPDCGSRMRRRDQNGVRAALAYGASVGAVRRGAQGGQLGRASDSDCDPRSAPAITRAAAIGNEVKPGCSLR